MFKQKKNSTEYWPVHVWEETTEECGENYWANSRNPHLGLLRCQKYQLLSTTILENLINHGASSRIFRRSCLSSREENTLNQTFFCSCLLFSHSVMSSSFAMSWTGAHQASLSMIFSGRNTGGGGHFLPQGIFLTHGLNPWLLGSWILCHWTSKEVPISCITHC